jgi:hypothetical protein
MDRQREPIIGTRARATGKLTEAEQLRRQAKRALQLADSVPYQQILCSLARTSFWRRRNTVNSRNRSCRQTKTKGVANFILRQFFPLGVSRLGSIRLFAAAP